MTNTTNVTRFFSAIFVILALVCLIFVLLLWRGFDAIESQQLALILQQHSVFLLKDLRFHVAEIQQFLTDIGATHQQQGFLDANIHLQAAQQALKALNQLHPELDQVCLHLATQINSTYNTGVDMAWHYIRQGIEAGNLDMAVLDASSNQLNENLAQLSTELETDLSRRIASNADLLHLNRLILISSAPIMLGIVSLFVAKTSRLLKKQMLDLADRTLQLNTLLNTAPSAIINIDNAGHILDFNLAAERIFGYSKAEVMGLNIKRLMPLDIDLESAAYLANEPDKSALHTVPEARELQALHKNGAALPILLRISPMELNGELYFSGVIDDLSKTKLLQAQLGQAQKMEAVGQLASGIAHEINTPIQYVGDNLKSLEDNFKDIISYQQALQTLGDLGLQSQFQQLANRYDINFILQDSPFAIKEALIGVERVSEIVKAMKNFSHVSTGQEHTLLNVHEALKNAITITRNTHKQIADVETDFSDQVDVIECDASELNQVFLNLIVNAVHAIEEQKHTRGLINITTRKLNTHNIEILISDNGAGIPLEIQEKVFNLFFTTKPIGKGTGQGLSLAYNIIVEKHHGQLFFESVPGSGTTFHLQLPIMFAEQA